MIIGKNITKSYIGNHSIIESANFKILPNTKVGIVGRNGCGKSTLLKMIVGVETFDSGSIDRMGERIGYVPQEFSFNAELVGELLENCLDNVWESYKIDTLVAQTEFNNYDPYQDIATLSLGQKMKLKVIETMLKDPTILLIDEPTNHLDIEGIIWFENYVKSLRIPVVLISHDREFLNNTVTEIWEIENKKILRFVGNYDFYQMEKLRLIDKWKDEYLRFVKHKEKLEMLLNKSRGISSGAGVEGVKKRIEREITQNEKQEYKVQKIKKVEFNNIAINGKLMIKFKEVTKKYENKTIFENVNFEIRGGEKVWLFGPNGAGKSTIIKLIMNKLQTTNGEVIIGKDVKIGYFAQDQTEFDYKENLLETFIKSTSCDLGTAYGNLGKFLFNKDSATKKISQLSPGQRARFAFAIFAYGNYDMLILDEPANHLDIETKEVIEQSLAEYKGTLLLVSHDRFFVEKAGITRVLNLKNGDLKNL